MTTEPLPSWMTDDPETMARVRANTLDPTDPSVNAYRDRLYCADPDCPDYGTPADASDPCPVSEVEPSPSADVDDPWAALPPLTLWERLCGATRGTRYLSSVRISTNRRGVLKLDLRSWTIGVQGGHWGGFSIHVGPLIVAVEEPPF